MQHFASSGKFHATVTLLAGILATFQYGCISTPPSGTAVSSQDSSPPVRHDGCPGSNGDTAACDLMAQKMQQMKRPENIDEFFANLHYIVYNDMLRNPVFYNSDEYLLKAFGANSIHRKEASLLENLRIIPSISIAILVGNRSAQRCEIYQFPSENGVQLHCNQEVLSYLYDRDSYTHGDEKPYQDKIKQIKLQDSLYHKFRIIFSGDWQNIDAFDRQVTARQYKEMFFSEAIPSRNNNYFSSSNSRSDYKFSFSNFSNQYIPQSHSLQQNRSQKFVPNGFGKDIKIGNIVYRIRAGRALYSSANGTWSGISIEAILEKYAREFPFIPIIFKDIDVS